MKKLLQFRPQSLDSFALEQAQPMASETQGKLTSIALQHQNEREYLNLTMNVL